MKVGSRYNNVKLKDAKISTNVKNKHIIIIIFLILGLFLGPLLLATGFYNFGLGGEEIKIKLSQGDSSEQYRRETREVQWIQNSQFTTEDGWINAFQGDYSDLDANISNDTANYILIGDSGTQEFYENGLSSDWIRINNTDGVALPTDISGGTFGMDSTGWYTSCPWPDNEPQSIRVQWMKNFTMNVNMSDYSITSASLDMWINGTVDALTVDDGGIDRPGDTLNSGTTVQIATGDFARFFLLISNTEGNRKFPTIQYQTDDLGKDGPPPITQLNDTLIMPLNEETLIFYLEQALKYDYQNFAITLGIYIWCEDSGHPGDSDDWESLIIKNFTLSISYEKKIDQFSSISWEYLGDQIEENSYRIEVTDAILNFDYCIDQEWPTMLSPNSEMKFFINDVEFSETIKLSSAESSFKPASDSGFDVTKLIPNDKAINISIQTYLADEFILSDNLTISIDNAILQIKYDVFIPVEESFLFPLLFALAALGATVLTIYIVYYQKVLKYPVPVRKVRKYRKSLNKEEPPHKPISGRKNAFNDIYNKELKKTSKFLKGAPLNGKIMKEKLFGKGSEKFLKE